MNSDNRKPGSIYANNFGAADQARVGSQETTVNVESVIIDLILKPFVNRLIDMQDEIMNQENLVIPEIDSMLHIQLMFRVFLNGAGTFIEKIRPKKWVMGF